MAAPVCRILATGLAVALLAGCGDAGSSPFAGAEEPRPGEGGRLFYAIAESPGDLDPLHAASFSAQQVARQIFEPLTARLRGPYSAGGPSRAGLALGWSHSGDSRVWTFRLRSGVRFQDGRRLDAAAVAANAERWRGDPVGRRLVPGLLAVAAPRPETLRLILADPLPNLPLRLADPRLGIVSPPALMPERGATASFLGARRSGSGAYELRGRVASIVVLERNRDWWGSGIGLGPALDEVVFRIVPDGSRRTALLRRGAVRIASGLSRRELRAIAGDPLLTALGGGPSPGGRNETGWIGFERSVRGIDSGRPVPLSGVWQALLGGAG